MIMASSFADPLAKRRIRWTCPEIFDYPAGEAQLPELLHDDLLGIRALHEMNFVTSALFQIVEASF